MKPRSYRILLVEDNRVDAICIRRMLKNIELENSSLLSFDLVSIQSIGQLLGDSVNHFDIILLDLSLPDSDGISTLDLLMHGVQRVPVIVLTGLDDELSAIDSVRRGAQDYLVKGKFSEARLLNAIEYAVERHRQLQSLRELALLDGLTGLYNRKGFSFLSTQHLALAHRNKRRMLLFYMDLDGMKTINDTLGHETGDTALVETARILRQTFRNSDIISRFGGDEFVVLALESKDHHKQSMIHRLRANVEERNRSSGNNYRISISIGVSGFSSDTPMKMDDMLRHADREMYLEKRMKKYSHHQNAASCRK